MQSPRCHWQVYSLGLVKTTRRKGEPFVANKTFSQASRKALGVSVVDTERSAAVRAAERTTGPKHTSSEHACFGSEWLQAEEAESCERAAPGEPEASSGNLHKHEHVKFPKTTEPGRVPRVRSAGTRPTRPERLCRRTVALHSPALHCEWLSTAAVPTGHDTRVAQSEQLLCLAETLREEGFWASAGWPMLLPLSSSSLGETWKAASL